MESRSPLAMATPTGGSAAMTELTAMARAPFIVDRGDDAVILQLELLIERQLRQRALLNNRERRREWRRPRPRSAK